MIRVVAFIGKAGSGKTTAANYLVSEGYTKIRFADGLKAMLRFGLGIGHDYIDGNKKNEPCKELCERTGRHAMMTLGTEWGRDMIHPDIWVMSLEREMNKLVAQGEYEFVIDDVRFLNEAEFVQDLLEIGIQSVLIRLIRGNEDSINHVSETEQDAIKSDYTILNEVTLEMLYHNVNNIVELAFKEK